MGDTDTIQAAIDSYAMAESAMADLLVELWSLSGRRDTTPDALTECEELAQ